MGLFVLGRIWVLADDVVKLWVVNKAAMLLLGEHELCRSSALHVRQIDMDEHEDDEDEHAIVMDDTHRHRATDPLGKRSERCPVHGLVPDAKA